MQGFYYLNDDKTYRPATLNEWSTQFEEMSINHTKHVANDIVNGCHISTVWLGLDHNHFGGRPLILETMVFNAEKGGEDIYCERYSTWAEAAEGHKKAVEWVKKGCKQQR